MTHTDNREAELRKMAGEYLAEYKLQIAKRKIEHTLTSELENIKKLEAYGVAYEQMAEDCIVVFKETGSIEAFKDLCREIAKTTFQINQLTDMASVDSIVLEMSPEAK